MQLKTQHFFVNVPFETFFFSETQKPATNSGKVIYNFQFQRQLRKPVGGFLFRCTNSVFNRIADDRTWDDPPGLLSQI
jgi:hypothetical protein